MTSLDSCLLAPGDTQDSGTACLLLWLNSDSWSNGHDWPYNPLKVSELISLTTGTADWYPTGRLDRVEKQWLQVAKEVEACTDEQRGLHLSYMLQADRDHTAGGKPFQHLSPRQQLNYMAVYQKLRSVRLLLLSATSSTSILHKMNVIKIWLPEVAFSLMAIQSLKTAWTFQLCIKSRTEGLLYLLNSLTSCNCLHYRATVLANIKECMFAPEHLKIPNLMRLHAGKDLPGIGPSHCQGCWNEGHNR